MSSKLPSLHEDPDEEFANVSHVLTAAHDCNSAGRNCPLFVREVPALYSCYCGLGSSRSPITFTRRPIRPPPHVIPCCRTSPMSRSCAFVSIYTHFFRQIVIGSMPLPPKGHFPSFKALETYAQNHAQHHGYAVVSIQ
jgi:hypothetical protein